MNRLRKIYYRIIQKTENVNDDRYHKYGAKGIKMCYDWRQDYKVFENWAIENGFYEQDSDKIELKNLLSIDRVDPKGDYTPENCQWITYSENSGKDKRLLSNLQVKEVREMYEDNIRICNISKKFGVSQAVIGGIVHNRTYKNIR